MKKQKLLEELNNNTYVIIRPSAIEGIGVFAIRDIPSGCRNMFSKSSGMEDEYVKISKEEVDTLPAYSKKLIETYCLYDSDSYYVPGDGFKKMDLVNFLNHFVTS